MGTFLHSTADVNENIVIGEGTRIWRWTCVRSEAWIGSGCNIGQCVYIDRKVRVGDRCKIQNGCNLYEGVVLEDDVFVGPSVTFTNVKYPRAAEPVKERTRTLVERGATIGANATIVCGVTVGAGAIVGAGSVVTKDVPPGKCVAGNPARIIGDAQPHGSAL